MSRATRFSKRLRGSSLGAEGSWWDPYPLLILVREREGLGGSLDPGSRVQGPEKIGDSDRMSQTRRKQRGGTKLTMKMNTRNGPSKKKASKVAMALNATRSSTRVPLLASKRENQRRRNREEAATRRNAVAAASKRAVHRAREEGKNDEFANLFSKFGFK